MTYSSNMINVYVKRKTAEPYRCESIISELKGASSSHCVGRKMAGAQTEGRNSREHFFNQL